MIPPTLAVVLVYVAVVAAIVVVPRLRELGLQEVRLRFERVRRSLRGERLEPPVPPGMMGMSAPVVESRGPRSPQTNNAIEAAFDRLSDPEKRYLVACRLLADLQDGELDTAVPGTVTRSGVRAEDQLEETFHRMVRTLRGEATEAIADRMEVSRPDGVRAATETDAYVAEDPATGYRLVERERLAEAIAPPHANDAGADTRVATRFPEQAAKDYAEQFCGRRIP